MGMQGAATMLAARVKLLHEYVAGVAEGRVPHNHALLRKIAAFLRQLPPSDSAAFERELLAEANDTLLMMLVTSMTHGVAQIQDMCDRVALTHGEKQTRMGRRGFF